MAALLRGLRVELVLTAHPTEAKRRTVLSKLQRIGEALRRLQDLDLLPRERSELLAGLQAEITALWLTDRARTTRPAVTDEVRTGLYFVDEVFWELVPRIDADLETAVALPSPAPAPPPAWLMVASWIGGGRDGNPSVVTELTAETLRLHRGLAVERHRRSVQDLARRLSVSGRRCPPPEALTAWLDARRPLPAHVAYLEQRYAGEPYRLALSLLAADLEAASREDMTARLLDEAPHAARATAAEVRAVVDLVAQGVPPALAGDRIRALEDQLETFGLHAARLDIREDSGRLAATLGGILARLGLEAGFAERDEPARAARLLRLLAEPAPKASEISALALDESASETWRLFRLLARAQAIYGRESLGPFIISMTRGPADLLTVLLLARWAGGAGGRQIVPLFETLGDLDAAPRTLEAVFALPVYRTHLASCDDEQMGMIGYSDSNKDGGYLAAHQALYRAQEAIARTCPGPAARGAPRGQPPPERGARDPLGVLLDAEPLQSPGLVRPRHRARTCRRGPPARDVRGLALLPGHPGQCGDVAAQGRHGHRRAILRAGAEPRARHRGVHPHRRRVRAYARVHPARHRPRRADGRRSGDPALGAPAQPVRGPAQLPPGGDAPPAARAGGPGRRRRRAISGDHRGHHQRHRGRPSQYRLTMSKTRLSQAFT